MSENNENNTPEESAIPLGTEKESAKSKKRRFGLSSSVLASLMVVGAVAAWLASGYVRDMKSATPDEIVEQPASPQNNLPKVKTRFSIAKSLSPKIIVRGGVIEAERSVTVRSEISGKVIASSATKEGSFVRKGDLLCGIAINNRQAEHNEASSLMELRNLQLGSAKKLSKQGYSTKISLTQARANYTAAKARLDRAQRALRNTSITAPFDGILEKIFVDVGDFMSLNTPCARVIDMEPLIISGNITEDEVVKIKPNESGWAILPDGSKLNGFVRYIAHSADAKTRTYRIELEVQEASGDKNSNIREGITVQIHIPLKAVRAHAIPPAILTLNETGEIGLRLIVKQGNKNIVKFMPIKIIEGNSKEYWVSGLPHKVNLIIVGQEYVSNGTHVAIDDKKEEN